MFKTVFTLLSILWSGVLVAQNYQDREALTQSYRDYKADAGTLFQAPPITHIVPNFNTITYALAYERRDVTIIPEAIPNAKDSSFQDSRNLKLTGYTVAPHLAISLKKVGLGFSVESSKNELRYTYKDVNYPSENYNQHTIVESSGIGFNLSFLPFEKLRKDNKLAMIIGAKSLNVRHQWTRFVDADRVLSESDSIQTRYSVTRYEAGMNLSLQLLKGFAVIPWVDFTHTHLTDARSAYIHPEYDDNGVYETYQDDVNVFWDSNPSFRYGVELALRISIFEVRVGSLFGAAASLNSTPDNIEDKTLTLSLSFDQQGS